MNLFGDQERCKRTLKELKEKTYPFPDFDVATMLEDLLDKKVIKLPECKWPEEMNRVNDLKYCKYHCIVGHPIGKCFVLKKLIMKLAQEGRIKLDLEEAAKVNTTNIVFGSFDPVPLCLSPVKPRPQSSKGKHEVLHVRITNTMNELSRLSNIDLPNGLSTNDNEGWTLVTRRKARHVTSQSA